MDFENTETSFLQESPEKYAENLKSGKINLYDIPKEYENHFAVVNAEIELGIRHHGNRGYDIIRSEFFVEDTLCVDETNSRSYTLTFSDFPSYFDFLSGDIYENSCYYQYDFPLDAIKKYNIQMDKIKEIPFERETADCYTLEMTEKEKQEAAIIEERKKYLQKYIRKAEGCKSIQSIYKMASETGISMQYGMEAGLLLYPYIYKNKNCTLQNLMQAINAQKLDADFRYILCHIYAPDEVVKLYYPENCTEETAKRKIRELKAYAESLNTKNAPTYYVKRFYDAKTEFFCVEVKADEGYHRLFSTTRYFESFAEFAEYLQNNLTGCDLSKAYTLQEDFSKYKTDETTILPIPYEKKVKYKIEKEYDKEDDRFYVKQNWKNKHDVDLKTYTHTFRYFFDFAAFLKNDLSHSNLLFCDGLIQLKNLETYHFTGAKLKGIMAKKTNIPYIPIQIDKTKMVAFSESMENENKNTAMVEVTDDSLSENDHYQKIYYATDLHLLHMLENLQCVSEQDMIYALQSTADKLLDFSNSWQENILILGGDIVSDFEIFKVFVRILSRTAKNKIFGRLRIFFVLGNHELWPFPSLQFADIVKIYADFLKKYGMHLLQNQLAYKDMNGNMHILDENDILNSNYETLRRKVRASSLLVLGGLGFSGYNERFNANNGIYQNVITREQEKSESEKFEKLYQHICECLPDRKVIVLTHTPPTDWKKSPQYQNNYIYIYGHTHKNESYDDGTYRIYADNQMGYHCKAVQSKYFYLDITYDYFADYGDGIYEITPQDYKNYYRGKNISMTFRRHCNKLFMLKKNNYYCFIHQSKEKRLSILNGGRLKALDRKDIQYYYDNMDAVIDRIEKPLTQYANLQKKVSDFVKSIGGDGRIHGAIVDIDFFNHIYVNPFDKNIYGYFAYDIMSREVYPSVENLLESQCPQMFLQYQNSKTSQNTLALIEKEVSVGCSVIDTNNGIYQASREMNKMQKLKDHILSIWIEPEKEQSKKRLS